MSTLSYRMCVHTGMLLILPSHTFQLLCWVDVPDKLPPHSPVLRLLPRQTLLPLVHIYTVMTCPYHFNLLSCTFFDISHTFIITLIFSQAVIHEGLTRMFIILCVGKTTYEDGYCYYNHISIFLSKPLPKGIQIMYTLVLAFCFVYIDNRYDYFHS